MPNNIDNTAIDIPERYNGAPTSYRLFDGFREAPPLIKGCYALCAILPGIGWAVDGFLELTQYRGAKKNAEAARAEITQGRTSATQPVYTRGYAGNPGQQQESSPFTERAALSGTRQIER